MALLPGLKNQQLAVLSSVNIIGISHVIGRSEICLLPN